MTRFAHRLDALRIAQFEYRRHVFSRRFLLSTLGLPLFMAAMTGVSLWASSMAREPDGAWGVVASSEWAAELDPSLERFADRAAAERALADGLAGYALLEGDGRALVRSVPEAQTPRALRSALREHSLRATLDAAPAARRDALREPSTLRFAALSTPDVEAQTSAGLIAALGVAFGLPMVFMITVLFSTGMLVTAVAEERAGRLLELLSSSAHPRALVAGKVIGLGAVGLTQTGAWALAGTAAAAFMLGPIVFEAVRVLWAPWLIVGLGFFVLGYLLYAAIMVAIGVIMGQPREAQQVAGIASLTLTLPFALMGLLLLRPASPAAVFLSVFPPTAPAAMPMRLALGAAPPTQVLLAFILLLLATIGAFAFVGRVFAVTVLGRGLRLPGRWWRRGPLRRGSLDADGADHAGSEPNIEDQNSAAMGARAPGDDHAGQRSLIPAAYAGKRAEPTGIWRRAVLVAVTELWTHLRRRSFLITTFGLPAVGLVVALFMAVAGATVARQTLTDLGGAFDVQDLQRIAVDPRVAIVDPGGFLDGVASTERETPQAKLLVVADRETALARMRAGDIDKVYVLPADYPSSRSVVTWRETIGPPEDAPELDRVLRLALWPDGDAQELANLDLPQTRVRTEVFEPVALADPAEVEPDIEDGGLDLEANPGPALLVLGLASLLYTSIFMASSFLLQSVTTEKENRVIELLLTSVPAGLLLGGKIVGLGVLGLLQLAIWTGSGLLLSQGGALALTAVAAIRLGPGVLLAGLVYFAFGYAFYAALMGAVGALVPSFQESGPLTFVVLFPAWTPFFFVEALLARPGGSLARALSLFPPTAPLVMMLRLSAGAVPWWEVVLGLGLLATASVAVVLIAARLFRASNLLAGSVPSPRGMLRALRREPYSPR